jgi:hypothetical protein
MVVDNVDDADVFFTQPQEHMATLFSATFWDFSLANQGFKVSSWVSALLDRHCKFDGRSTLCLWGISPDEAVRAVGRGSATGE